MVYCNNFYGYTFLVGKKMAINEKMKWPTNKERYDKNYLRLFGEKCLTCGGTGQVGEEIIQYGRSMGFKECPKCNGIGYVEKKK